MYRALLMLMAPLLSCRAALAQFHDMNNGAETFDTCKARGVFDCAFPTTGNEEMRPRVKEMLRRAPS